MPTSMQRRGLTLGDRLNQQLMESLPPQTVPFSQAAVKRLAEGFLALRTIKDGSTIKVSKPGVDVSDLEMSLDLGPGVMALLEVRSSVLELTMTHVDKPLEPSTSGRVSAVAPPDTSTVSEETPEKPLVFTEPAQVVDALLNKLSDHPRLGHLPPSLAETLRKGLMDFCRGSEGSEKFEMDQMLWERLEVQEGKWIVKVNHEQDRIELYVDLLRRGQTTTVEVDDGEGGMKTEKKDTSYVQVSLYKTKKID